MRAKFLVVEVTPFERDGATVQENVKFRAVPKPEGYPEDGSDEDNTFAKFTPSADLSISINNPALFGRYEVGQKWYADFTPADIEATLDGGGA